MPEREAVLRARLAEQEAALQQLRSEVGWLTQELVARDAGIAPPPVDGAPPEWAPMLHSIRRLVHRRLAENTRVAVVSSGVEALLRHAGHSAEHLSQDRFGDYTGTPPSCGRVAIAQLEAARWRGVEAFLIPRSELWWFEHFPDFERHLYDRYARIADDEVAGVIWSLREPSPLRDVHDLLATLDTSDHRPALLDWNTGDDLASVFGELKVFAPLGDPDALPYLDGTIDVVAVRGRNRLDEARRVASSLVLSFVDGRVDVAWRAPDVEDALREVSLVIASRDGAPAAPGFLERLAETLPAGFGGEVVVDGACVPDLRARPPVTIVDCSTVDRFDDRLERCADAASGDLLVVLDGATWPTPGFLRPLVAPLRSGDAGFVTGSLVQPDGRLLGDPDTRPDAVRHGFVRRIDKVPTRFFSARRELVFAADDGEKPCLFEPAALAIAAWDDTRANARTEARIA